MSRHIKVIVLAGVMAWLCAPRFSRAQSISPSPVSGRNRLNFFAFTNNGGLYLTAEGAKAFPDLASSQPRWKSLFSEGYIKLGEDWEAAVFWLRDTGKYRNRLLAGEIPEYDLADHLGNMLKYPSRLSDHHDKLGFKEGEYLILAEKSSSRYDLDAIDQQSKIHDILSLLTPKAREAIRDDMPDDQYDVNTYSSDYTPSPVSPPISDLMIVKLNASGISNYYFWVLANGVIIRDRGQDFANYSNDVETRIWNGYRFDLSSGYINVPKRCKVKRNDILKLPLISNTCLKSLQNKTVPNAPEIKASIDWDNR